MTMFCLIMMTLLRKMKTSFVILLIELLLITMNQSMLKLKTQKWLFFDRGSETDKTMGKWSLREEKMKMLAKKIKLQKK